MLSDAKQVADLADSSCDYSSSGYEEALLKARREERLTEAMLRRKRAEIARLIAIGQEAAANQIIAEISGSKSVKVARVKKQAERQSVVAKAPEAKQPTKILKKTNQQKTVAPSTKPSARREATKSQSEQTLKIKPSQQKTSPKRTAWRRKTLIQRWGEWLGSRPPWLVSTVVHCMLLATFALLTFASIQETPFTLNASFTDQAFDEPIAEIQLVDWQPLEEASEPETKLAESSTLSEELVVEQEIAQPTVTSVPLSQSMSLDSASLMAPVEGASSDSSDKGDSQTSSTKGESAGEKKTNTGPPGKVSFFGAEDRANRIVFVVDNSGSMQRGRMETALKELDYAVRRLSEDQEFYVLFYSDQAYPMFFPNSVHELLPATRENKKKLNKWLRTVEICLGGRLIDAVEKASTLDPELVFLLSDGDIRSPRVMEQLTKPEAWPFKIHTLGMGARSKQHAENLVRIAQANEGGYKFVDAHPTAVRRSFAKPLPYHRTPGNTWGSAVQEWK